jgi:hypothetical protein
MPAIAKTAEDLWEQLDRKPNGCWEWVGRTDDDGYGSLNRVVEGVRYQRAHRLAYRYGHGPIPTGMIVMHRCDNPPCCNPEHLKLGTTADNNADMVAKGRNRYLSGAEHWSARNPERVSRGGNHYLRKDPEARARNVEFWKNRSKITDEQVVEMRNLYAAGGWTFDKLAERYGISSGHAHGVVRRIYRTDVE